MRPAAPPPNAEQQAEIDQAAAAAAPPDAPMGYQPTEAQLAAAQKVNAEQDARAAAAEALPEKTKHKSIAGLTSTQIRSIKRSGFEARRVDVRSMKDSGGSEAHAGRGLTSQYPSGWPWQYSLTSTPRQSALLAACG